MRNKLFLYSLGVVLGLGLLFFPSNHTVAEAGDIVFEVPLVPIDFLESWNYKIAQQYTPVVDQTVCSAEHSISTGDRSLTNSLVLSVYLSDDGPTPRPETGTKIAEVSMLNSFLRAPSPTYVSMEFESCLNLLANRTYFFVWSRNPITIPLPLPITYNYYSLGAMGDTMPRTSYWNFTQFAWYENSSRDWSFRLRGPVTQLKEPVIIVPGTMGSRLNRTSDGVEVWPNFNKMFLSTTDNYLDELKLDNSGNELPGTLITVGSILDKFGLFPAYNKIIDFFISHGYVLNQDLFVATYDWRKSISDSNQILADKIQEALQHSIIGKVNLIGHSMGALAVRDYLSKQPDLNFIDNALLVGTPNIGGPQALKVLTYGDDMGLAVFGLGLNPNKAKEIAQNMPGIYQLLPSAKYFDANGGYVKDFRNGANKTLNFTETNDFMLADPFLSDHRNPLLLDQASQWHEYFDQTDLQGTHVYNITGCGLSTIGGLRLYNKDKIDVTMVKGDGTVPLISADYMCDQGTTYYALPMTYSDHLNLVQDSTTLELIGDLVENRTPGELFGITLDHDQCVLASKKNLLVATFSPVNLHVYDSQGQHTGLKPNGDIELGIPDSDFFQLDENSFILLPEEDNYRIVIDAYASGSFDLKVRELDGDQVSQSVNFLDIPIASASLIGEFNFSGFGDQGLNLDTDGDGDFDQTVQPSSILYGAESNDITPPDIEILSPASPSYPRSQIIPVSINVSDSESGVDFYVNKFDGYILDTASHDLFYYSLGSHSLETIAYDRAGNLGSKIFQFQFVATIDSTISDIERSYDLGWISKKSVKNQLIRKLNDAARIEKKIEYIDLILPNNQKSRKRIERLEKRLDKILGKTLLNEVERQYTKGNINQLARDIIKEDLQWLMKH